MIKISSFKPAWWLPNAHAQTIYPTLGRRLPPTISKVEVIELPDGDFLNLSWSTGQLAADTPLVVILHGLSGGVNSAYVARFMRAFNARGWRAVLMHFRGSGEQVNRLPRAYHSGDTADLDFVMNRLQEQEPATLKALVGVSLGGNVLLKWLGEQKEKATVQAAVAISVPFVLSQVANRMNQGFSKVYQRHLLQQLKQFYARKEIALINPPEVFKKIANCHCFWTFDHQVTAPLHGFSGAHSYYRQSSCRPFLRAITVPTLIIHAKDDPFMTPDVIPTEEELSDSVSLELSAKGGHVGFVTGSIIGKPVYWLDERIANYIAPYFS